MILLAERVTWLYQINTEHKGNVLTCTIIVPSRHVPSWYSNERCPIHIILYLSVFCTRWMYTRRTGAGQTAGGRIDGKRRGRTTRDREEGERQGQKKWTGKKVDSSGGRHNGRGEWSSWVRNARYATNKAGLFVWHSLACSIRVPTGLQWCMSAWLVFNVSINNTGSDTEFGQTREMLSSTY